MDTTDLSPDYLADEVLLYTQLNRSFIRIHCYRRLNATIIYSFGNVGKYHHLVYPGNQSHSCEIATCVKDWFDGVVKEVIQVIAAVAAKYRLYTQTSV